MVFLPSRLDAFQESPPAADDRAISPGARAIIDLIDVVGSMRDVEHLQCVTFLAQEFGLLLAPTFQFGSRRAGEGGGPELRHPHSLLLEGHFYALLCEKVIDRDATGYLRPRRDLYAVPYSGLASRRLAVLGALPRRDLAVFAGAVLRLAQDGCHAGSARRDTAFHHAVALLATVAEGDEMGDDGSVVDIGAICAARQRLMPTELLLLNHQLSAAGR